MNDVFGRGSIAGEWNRATERFDGKSTNPKAGQALTFAAGELGLVERACSVDTLRQIGSEGASAAARFADALADVIATNDLTPDTLSALKSATGETGLMLSGGGKLGNYHIGVIRLLHRDGLLPRVISGSSAGSIMAAMIGTRTDIELSEMIEGDAHALISDMETGEMDYDVTTLDQNRVKSLIARIVPDLTFKEAAAIGGRAINIVVAYSSARDGGLVLNADNAPDVLLRDAVLASCAVPYVYRSVRLHERKSDGRLVPFDGGVRWIDGSVYADLPAAFLRRHYGVTRLVASIVNPVELPFLTDPDFHGAFFHHWASTVSGAMRSIGSAWIGAVLPVVRHVPVGGRAMALWKQVLDQRIDADVIIAPGQRFHNPLTLLQQASEAQMSAFIVEGEAAASARLGLIAPALRIEAALRRAQTPAVAKASEAVV